MIEGQEGVSWPEWLALARACEEHGVPALFRSDHYLNLDGRPERGSLDAWATINALAAATTTLRLGTLVSPATFRHPSELAKAVVTADHVSGGRVELGFGAGWHEGEHRAYGFPFPDVRERMDRLAEQLEIIHGSWTSAPFSFSGAHYALEDLDAQPRPVQQPHPPLIMGGAGGRRSAALAARWADEYNTPLVGLDEVRERRARVRRGVRGGRPRADPVLSDDRAAGRAATATSCGGGRPRSPRARDADEFSPDADAWIVGTVDEAIEQLLEVRSAGVSRVMLQHLLHTDLDVVEIIGRELAPAVA